MRLLSPNEESRTKTLSSIDQYRRYLSTYERGGWTPIQFDQIDYIRCIDCQGGNKYQVVSHPVIIEFGDEIGYRFPVGECGFTTDTYPLFDKAETELLPLPECCGEGFYEAYHDGQIILNFDNGTALGMRNNYRLKIGLDYTLANDFLEGRGAEE